MKKLLSILLITLFSTIGFAKTGDVYYCDELQHRTIYPHAITENFVNQNPIFKFKLDDENLIIYTKEEDIEKNDSLPEFALYPIVYQDFNKVISGKEIEIFGAQNLYKTIIYADGTYFEISLGDLKNGPIQPFENILKTATCKIY